MDTKEEIIESCKKELKDHIEQLQDLDVRAAYIEIEIMSYVRKLVREERH